MRVVCLQESLVHGKTLLFDSAHVAVVHEPGPTTPSASNATRRAAKDLERVAELMFGALPLKVGQDCTKVHHLAAEHSLLVTRIFSITMLPATVETRAAGGAHSNSMNAAEENEWRHVFSLDAIKWDHMALSAEAVGSSRSSSTSQQQQTQQQQQQQQTQHAQSENHARLYSSATNIAGLPPPRSPATSISSVSDLSAPPLTSYQSGNIPAVSNGGNMSIYHTSPAVPEAARPFKGTFGVGILLPLPPASPGTPSTADMNDAASIDRLMTNFPVLRSKLTSLSHVVRTLLVRKYLAVVPKRGVLAQFCLQADAVIQASVAHFQTTVELFFNTPRLANPLWLSWPEDRRQGIIIALICRLVPQLDGNRKHHVLSALLTATLMRNLSWIRTVSPRLAKLLGAGYTSVHAHAQLVELFGGAYRAVTADGVDVTRIAVAASDGKTVDTVLHLLTYFLRGHELVRCPVSFEPVADASADEAVRKRDSEEADDGGEAAAGSDDGDGKEGAAKEGVEEESAEKAEGEYADHLPTLDEDTRDVLQTQFESFPSAPSCASVEMRVREDDEVADPLGDPVAESLVRSLMATFSGKYADLFATIGLPALKPHLSDMGSDLRSTVDRGLLGMPVRGAAYIVGDVQQGHCTVLSCGHSDVGSLLTLSGARGQTTSGTGVVSFPVRASDFITATLLGTRQLFELGLPPAVCCQYIDDRLADLCDRGYLLASLVQNGAVENSGDVMRHLSCQLNDVPLLAAVANAFDPTVAGRIRPGTDHP